MWNILTKKVKPWSLLQRVAVTVLLVFYPIQKFLHKVCGFPISKRLLLRGLKQNRKEVPE